MRGVAQLMPQVPPCIYSPPATIGPHTRQDCAKDSKNRQCYDQEGKSIHSKNLKVPACPARRLDEQVTDYEMDGPQKGSSQQLNPPLPRSLFFRHHLCHVTTPENEYSLQRRQENQPRGCNAGRLCTRFKNSHPTYLLIIVGSRDAHLK